MARYAIRMKDGSVSIMQTVGEITVKECLAKWHPDQSVSVISWREVQISDLPQDRTFRDAWKDDGAIEIDMPKAREIHKDKLRRDRAPLLAALDVDFVRAVETGDTAKQAEIVAQKQALRDVTEKPDIEAAETPDELKAVTI